jgi:hypothetical protein
MPRKRKEKKQIGKFRDKNFARTILLYTKEIEFDSTTSISSRSGAEKALEASFSFNRLSSDQ